MEKQPPPPPLISELAGIRTIRVEVTEKGNPGHLDGEQLARAAAREINDEDARSGLSAQLQREGGPADAILAVEITDETALQSMYKGSPVANSWHFEFTWSEVLISPDGTVRWQKKNQHVEFTHRFQAVPRDDIWKDRAVRQAAADEFRISIAPSLWYRIQ